MIRNAKPLKLFQVVYAVNRKDPTDNDDIWIINLGHDVEDLIGEGKVDKDHNINLDFVLAESIQDVIAVLQNTAVYVNFRPGNILEIRLLSSSALCQQNAFVDDDGWVSVAYDDATPPP